MDLKINSGYDKIIIVDPGKNSVKAFCFDENYELKEKLLFPSKSKKKRNFFDIDSGSEHQYQVEFEGSKYLVGEGILDNYNFETTKNNMHHKLCIYTAIANFVEKEKEKIHLVIGYPSSDYTNIDQRNDYLRLINSEFPVSMMVNGELKTFEIKSISVYPEGIALVPRLKNSGKKVHVIDIGGQNTNYRYYDVKGNTLAAYSLDEAGTNHLQGYLKGMLRKFVKADKINVDALDLTKSIMEGRISEIPDEFLNNYPNTKEFVLDTVLEFIEESILHSLQEKGANLYQRGDFIIFTGGGSMLLKPYLEECINNNKDNMYFSTTAQWDNCISYAVRDVGDRCKKENKLKEAQLIGQKIIKQTDFSKSEM